MFRASYVAILLSALLILVGCPTGDDDDTSTDDDDTGDDSPLQFSELPPFGDVASAVWLDLDMSSSEAGEDNQHHFMLSNRPDLCVTLQQEIPILMQIADDIMESAAEIDEPDPELCDMLREMYEVYAVAFGDHLDSGDHLLSPWFHEMGDGGGIVQYVEPADGEHEHYNLNLSRFEGNPYLTIAEHIEFAEEMGDSFCYGDEANNEALFEALTTIADTWSLTEGTANSEHQGEDEIVLQLSGDLVSIISGDDGGSVDGEVTVSHCPVSVETTHEPYLIPFHYPWL